MIRSSYPSEVFSRYSHRKSSSVISLFDQFLPAYRWAESVLEVGTVDSESLRALQEYMPDSVVHSLSASRFLSERRLISLSYPFNPAEFVGRFAVIVVTDDSDPLPLKNTLKSYGLLVVENPTSDLPEFRTDNSIAYYLRLK